MVLFSVLLCLCLKEPTKEHLVPFLGRAISLPTPKGYLTGTSLSETWRSGTMVTAPVYTALLRCSSFRLNWRQRLPLGMQVSLPPCLQVRNHHQRRSYKFPPARQGALENPSKAGPGRGSFCQPHYMIPWNPGISEVERVYGLEGCG